MSTENTNTKPATDALSDEALNKVSGGKNMEQVVVELPHHPASPFPRLPEEPTKTGKL